MADAGEPTGDAKTFDERRQFGQELIRDIEANDDVERRDGANRMSQRDALAAAGVGTGATAITVAADFANNPLVTPR